MKTAKPVGGTRSRAGVPRGDAGSVKGETGGTPVFADLVFDVSPVPMWVYDPVTLEFLRVNDAAIRAYGFSREQFLAMTLLDIRPAEDREAYAAWARERDLSTTFRTPQRWRHLRADGSIVYVDSHYSERFVDEGRDAVLAIVLDLTDQKAEADRLHALAFTDQATGLPNRAGLLDRVERERFPVGGLVLVRVAWVAESASRSQAARERAVRAIAAKLCALAPRDALVTRYGDQSFAMVTRRTERLRAPLPIARKIATAFERPVQTGAEEFVVVPTIGVASAEDGATSVADIALNAEAALGQAERNPNRIAVFTEDIQRAHDRRATVERNLRNAIVQERVGVVYQPIVALATGTVVGAEALMRWDCPGLGPVPPSEFIAIAEESGVILRLGEWILRAAVLEARRWQLAGLGRLRIAVNVSPLQVEQREFVRLVLSSCEAVGLDPADVELEITERVMMHRDGPAMRNLEALRRLGVRVSIDDFGTGYSALSYLSSVPLDTVKLDRGFVDAVNADAYQTDIAADVIRLARGRGLTVVAEGIETPAQRDWLRTVGCDEAQGYLFARPADAENFPAVVAALQRDAAG